LTVHWVRASVLAVLVFRMIGIALCALPCLIPLIPRPAEAAEEEIVLAFEPGYGLLAGKDTHGAGVQLSVWAVVSEAFWLAASAGELVFFESGGNRRGLTELAAGLVAAFDVLRTIPFAELMIGLDASGGTLVPTFRAGVGADYLISRKVSIGGVARYRPLNDQISSHGLLTIQLRLSWRFEL
jgi:hypothetical protein